jgi:hypothetical protein
MQIMRITITTVSTTTSHSYILNISPYEYRGFPRQPITYRPVSMQSIKTDNCKWVYKFLTPRIGMVEYNCLFYKNLYKWLMWTAYS